MKKSSNALTYGIMMVVFFALGVLMIVSDKYLFKDEINLNEAIANGTVEKGQYVTFDVDAIVDWYAETDYKINGIIPAGKEQHCIVWADDTVIISMTVKGSSIAQVDGIIDATYEYLTGGSISLPYAKTFKGKVMNIDPEVKKYYTDAMNVLDISAADGFTIYEFTVDTTESKGETFLVTGILAVLGVVFLLLMMRDIKNGKDAKLMASAGGSVVNTDDYMSDMYNGMSMETPAEEPVETKADSIPFSFKSSDDEEM